MLNPDDLRQALRECGYDWLFAWWGEDTEKGLAGAADQVNQFIAQYEQEFGERPDPMALLDSSPSKAAAFFHPTTLAASSPIKCAIWRILCGASIESLEFEYHRAQPPSLSLQIKTTDGETEAYSTASPADFKVLRHLGASMINDTGLILDGYYAPAAK